MNKEYPKVRIRTASYTVHNKVVMKVEQSKVIQGTPYVIKGVARLDNEEKK